MCSDCQQTRALVRSWGGHRVPRARYPRMRWFLIGAALGAAVSLLVRQPRAGTTFIQQRPCQDVWENPRLPPKAPGIRL